MAPPKVVGYCEEHDIAILDDGKNHEYCPVATILANTAAQEAKRLQNEEKW